MADPNFISVNFGNMEQMVTEMTSIHNATRSTMDDYVARINNTTMQDANWSGPGGKEHWANIQRQAYQHLNRMHDILNGARGTATELSQKWPSWENQVTGLWT